MCPRTALSRASTTCPWSPRRSQSTPTEASCLGSLSREPWRHGAPTGVPVRSSGAAQYLFENAPRGLVEMWGSVVVHRDDNNVLALPHGDRKGGIVYVHDCNRRDAAFDCRSG